MIKFRPIHNQSSLIPKTWKDEKDLAYKEHGLVIGVDESTDEDDNSDDNQWAEDT